MNKANLFLSRLSDLEIKALPEAVLLRAKYALLDYIGVTLAGLFEQKEKVDSLTEQFCESAGEIKPIGIPTAMSMNNAVFLNGLNAHALDFDDGTNAGIIHLGSPIFSVLLALAQKYEISSELFLKAVIMGYETSFTMAMTIQPMHKKRGYHASGTCGVLGIAKAASMACGYDERLTARAFATAAVSASGSLKVLEDGSQLKPYNVAKAALLGLTAVQMAKAGFEAPDDVLSGTAGFLKQMCGTEDIELVQPLLNGTYAIEKAYIKPYAACRYTHPAIDAARNMRESCVHSPDEIEKIVIKTYSLAVNKHDHVCIHGSASAKMSIPYNFAVTYLTGKTGMDAFGEELLNDCELQALTKKIIVEEDSEMTALFPSKTIAQAELRLKNGKVITGQSILPKGEPENPLTSDEIIGKFTSLARFGGKSEAETKKIADAVFHIETKFPELLRLLG